MTCGLCTSSRQSVSSSPRCEPVNYRFNPSQFSGSRTGAMVGGAASAAGMLESDVRRDRRGLFGVDWHDVATSVLVGTVTAITTQIFLDIIERRREDAKAKK